MSPEHRKYNPAETLPTPKPEHEISKVFCIRADCNWTAKTIDADGAKLLLRVHASTHEDPKVDRRRRRTYIW